jgi:hypothetical protein
MNDERINLDTLLQSIMQDAPPRPANVKQEAYALQVLTARAVKALERIEQKEASKRAEYEAQQAAIENGSRPEMRPRSRRAVKR